MYDRDTTYLDLSGGKYMTLNQKKHNKSESVKLKAIKEILENGKAVAKLANQIGVHRTTLYN
jgi:transposase-like protein